MRASLARDGLAAAATFLVSLGVLAGTVRLFGIGRTPVTAVFPKLADSFLNGRLGIPDPGLILDLTFHDGTWYVPFPPLPAILLMPVVAVLGVQGANTVWFSVGIGALTAGFAFLGLQELARAGVTQLGRSGNLWLTALLVFGSVHFYSVMAGSVWFLGQICALCFVALAFWLAQADRRLWSAATALALAMLARPTIGLTIFLLLGLDARRVGSVRAGPGPSVRRLLPALVPPAIAVLALLAYNRARFGSFTDFGYLTQNVHPTLITRLTMMGQFSLQAIPDNLRAMLLLTPIFDPARGGWTFDPEGMSLFITTPALLYLFRVRDASPVARGAWVSLVLLLVPLVTYYNTGWIQFGYRFSLDFMVPALVLLALAMRSGLTGRFRVLVGIGILVNVWGAWRWFVAPGAG